jgi:hypothetical protein
MATPGDLIKRALRDAGVLGVGQNASAEDANDAFDKINSMLAQWNLRRWLVYHLTDTAVVSTGATSYTVGPGGAFNIPRPDRIEGAYIRQTNTGQSVDYPVRILEAYEDYARIGLKSLVTLPSDVFYDAGFPLGTLHFYPSPNASIYEMHILTKAVLSAFTSLTQVIALPPEYEEALIYNLAVRLRPAYQMAPDPTVTQLAKAALNSIKNAKMPAALSGHGGRFNVYTGL